MGSVLLIVDIHVHVPVVRSLLIKVSLPLLPELSVSVEIEPRATFLPDQLYLELEVVLKLRLMFAYTERLRIGWVIRPKLYAWRGARF